MDSQPPSTSKDHQNPIILFTFPESVFGLRVARYLNLRSIPFTQVRVPPNMPRPILSSQLGINYRRIPVLAIGRDAYIDTRLIIRKLEETSSFDGGAEPLGAKDAFGSGIEDMLEEFIIDGGPFWRTAGLIPTDSPLVQDPVWMRDRFEGSGGLFTVAALEDGRAWNLSQVKLYFGMLEKMLSDGRKWVLGGERPGLAEVHAAWVFDWAVGMAEGTDDGRYAAKEDLMGELGEEKFPHVWGWVRRFRQVCEEAQRNNKGAGPLYEGAEAEADVADRILSSEYNEPQTLAFDDNDILGLRYSQRVSIAPTDFGSTHRDEGKLVGLTKSEAVLQIPAPSRGSSLRLHYPRINFKILPVD